MNQPRRFLLPGLMTTLLTALMASVGCGGPDGDVAPRSSECLDDEDCGLGRRCASGECVDTRPNNDENNAPNNDENNDAPLPATVCAPCRTDDDCGRPGDLCLTLPDGRFCGRDCTDDPTPCPTDSACDPVGDRLQCVPTSGVCAGCFDPDGDDYGQGDQCRGPDCRPDDGDSFPGAEELCDGVDNDCDGDTDEDFNLDSDMAHCGGCGQPCAPPGGARGACVEGVCTVVECPFERGDCDGDPANGCESTLTLFFLDGDGDRFGRGDIVERACRAPEGYVAAAGDCDDADPARHPGVMDVCDGVDNDCDNTTDEDSGAPLADLNLGVCEGARRICNGRGDFVEPDYQTIDGFELDETSCDGVDNDCDGEVDEECDPCAVPFGFATVQEAADARCTTIRIQPGAPAIFTLLNPPEDVTLRPERGRVELNVVTLQLERGHPRQIRFEQLSVRQLDVNNADQNGSVTIDRLHVINTRGLASAVTLTGFNITVQDSLFEGNVATAPNNIGGVFLMSLVRDFRLLRNTFRDNRVENDQTRQAGGVLFIEDPESSGLLSGNLFVSNQANGAEAAGAVLLAAGVGNILFENNTFVDNANGLNLQASAVQCLGPLPGGAFRNNIMWDQTGRHIQGCAQAPITYSNHDNAAADGPGNISADPRLTPDFHLQPDSPCRNTGDPDPRFNDLDATRNDMGHTGGPFGQP